jgi:2-polyprenyl-3-methyl-5-hydroxy-6-metoxy-1,4-benzoquinol methylase
MLNLLRKVCGMLEGKSYTNSLKEELVGFKTILDIGCGASSPICSCSKSCYSVGIDIFKPAILRSKKQGIHDDYVLADLNHSCFKPASFETVLAVEVLEHLKKADGYRFLKTMKTLAEHAILIVTPNGFLSQEEYDKNPYQEHLSGWTSTELRMLGFHVNGINGLKFLREEKADFRFKPKVLFSHLSNMSQKLAYHFPSLAFQLICVKKLQSK